MASIISIPERLMGTNSPWTLPLQMAPSALGAEVPSSLSETGRRGEGKDGARPPGTPRQLFSVPPCVKSHAPNLSASTSSASSANAETIKELISRWVGRGCGPEADGTHQYSLPSPLQAPRCPYDPRLLPCFLFSGPNAPLTLLPHFSAILALSPTPNPSVLSSPLPHSSV